ncbi:MAG: hypothetical protein Q8R48_05540 [Candidatus Omnitrophota bacterium]|nr:hypothetical protein [Candidatus Omnitrophota bacterium]
MLDSIKYKSVELEKGEKVLVERFSGKVRYFWNKDTNEWTSTSITPELERTFQFMYEQTKAPKGKPKD